MIVTTSARRQQDLLPQAKRIAQELQAIWVPRGKHSVEGMLKKYCNQDLLLVSKDGLKLYPQFKAGKEKEAGTLEPFFFHPSSAMFRLKRIIRGEADPFLEATRLQDGMTILDTTLGLASDAIIASYAVGEKGQVEGLESEKVLAYIVEQGLQTWATDMPELEQAMKRIKVIQGNHLSLLRQYPEDSFDVVYFDPMFEVSVDTSAGLSALKSFANFSVLSAEAVQEAKRVARRRVVLKESSYSERFAALGFQPIVRKYASHWFGTIEIK